MSHERNLTYLNNNRIVYRRLPITDIPTEENWMYLYYKDGTHECYDLFRSKAQINTYKSLKWHLLVLWYLNPQLDQDKFLNLAKFICDKLNNFITFAIHEDLLNKIVYEVSMCDLEEPPKNKIRKVIFKPNCGLTKEEKLKIVGIFIGRTKRITKDNIYECMLEVNNNGNKITISKLAKLLNCTSRTIHRNMGVELKREKELLNEQL